MLSSIFVSIPQRGDGNCDQSTHFQYPFRGCIAKYEYTKSKIKILFYTPVISRWPRSTRKSDLLLHRAGVKNGNHHFPLNQRLSITTSKELLFAIADHKGPKDYIFALGYAGWETGQLGQEIVENVWLCGPADPQIIFELPPENQQSLRRAAGALLGVDMDALSSQVGHA